MVSFRSASISAGHPLRIQFSSESAPDQIIADRNFFSQFPRVFQKFLVYKRPDLESDITTAELVRKLSGKKFRIGSSDENRAIVQTEASGRHPRNRLVPEPHPERPSTFRFSFVFYISDSFSSVTREVVAEVFKIQIDHIVLFRLNFRHDLFENHGFTRPADSGDDLYQVRNRRKDGPFQYNDFKSWGFSTEIFSLI